MTTILPADLIVRAPREDELEAICELLNACDVAECGQFDSPLDQLRSQWAYKDFHRETDAWVAVAPGEHIVGYAALAPYRYINTDSYVRIHPDYWGQGIGTHLRALIDRRAQEFVPLAPPEVRVILSTWCHSGNQAAKQLIEAAGYTCNRRTWAMEIDLPEEPAQPEWPAGISLRPFEPERDARAVFEATDEAFQDHWGHLPGIFANWYQNHIVNNASFDPSLWFMAMAGDEVAGVSLCGYYLDGGIVNTLGVRRPWRHLGLGMALLRYSFGEFYRRGIHTVGLGVDSQSLTGATRLYERAGMHILMSYDHYEKELRAGVDLSTQTLEV
jgi:mycothiol synthase